MGITNFDQIQANTFIGPMPESNPFGATYYINGTTGADTGSSDGKSAGKAFASIAYAISRSSAGDNFIIAPGTYSSAAAIVPLAYQSFRAGVINPRNPTVKITATSAVTTELLQVDVAGCSFYGLEFLAGDNALTNLVDIADTADVAGCWFHTCVFNGADKTSVAGIQMDDATFIPTGVVIENCLFRDLTGTMIDVGVLGMPYALIKNNTLVHDINSGIGIALADTSAFATGKGWVIEHNDFLPFDSTGDEVGISIAGTEDTTGAGIIRNNYFSYSAATTAITIDKLGKATINNYTAAATGGGTLVTTGS